LTMIKLKEDLELRENSIIAMLMKTENEMTDLQFLANQKDFKIQELDR
jgi:hypothetical protein